MAAASGLKGKLLVTVHKARDLHNVELIGKQDPYVIVHVGHEQFKSKVSHDGGMNPEWEQAFLFNLTGLEDACHFMINDNQLIGHRPIGRLDLPLQQLAQIKGQQWFQVFDVNNFAKMAGQLLLSVEYTGTGLIVSDTHTQTTSTPVQSQPPIYQQIQPQIQPVPQPVTQLQPVYGQFPGQPCGGYAPQPQPMMIPVLDQFGQQIRDAYGQPVYQPSYPQQGYSQGYAQPQPIVIGQPVSGQPVNQPGQLSYPSYPQQPQPVPIQPSIPIPVPVEPPVPVFVEPPLAHIPVPTPVVIQPVIIEKKPEMKVIDFPHDLYTPDAYNYQLIHEIYNQSSSFFIFNIKASNDVHIALSTNPEFPSGDHILYEIVFGGWGNTKSAIRRGRQGTNHVHIDTPQLLSSQEYHSYWISWLNGHIRLGQGHTPNQHVIMEWHDPNPLPVRYIGVCTGWGATGHWYIPKQPRHVQTPDAYNYQMIHDISGSSSSSLIFKVRASNDVHIALSTHHQFHDGENKLYEIVLGGWDNNKSVIRRGRQHQEHTHHDGKILSSHQYHTFWITWLHGHIQVGTGSQLHQHMIMEWHDSQPLHITHIGICTGWGSTGDWLIEPIQSNKQLETPDAYDYRMVHNVSPYYLSCTGFGMIFHVRASNDAHIALSSDSQFSNGDNILYEIVFGSSGNQHCAIRRGRQQQHHVNPHTPELLSKQESRPFWLSYSQQSGLIRVGTGYHINQHIIMEWVDSQPLPIKHIGICTGWGANGDWVIEPLQSLNLNDIELYTHDDYNYQLIHAFNHSIMNHMIIDIIASNDTHIALSRHESFPHGEHELYEIVLGGWGNTKSVIRRGRQRDEMISQDTPNLLSSSHPHTFWISWLNGHIRVGHGHIIHNNVIMEWKDHNPITIQAIGGCTGWGSTGRWICNS